jgi:hypothetical protein
VTPAGHGTGNAAAMTVALFCRTVVVAGWLLALGWAGAREPAAVVSAVALLALWAASLMRDGSRARLRGSTGA